MSAAIWTLRKAPNEWVSLADRRHWRHLKRSRFVFTCRACCTSTAGCS